MIAKFCIATFTTALKINCFLQGFFFFFLIFKSSHYHSETLILGLEVKKKVTLQNQCTF